MTSPTLIERLEAASEGSDELSAQILAALVAPKGATVKQSPFNSAWCVWDGPRLWEARGADHRLIVSSPTTSLDAALALAERVLVMPYKGPISLTIAGSGLAHIDHIDPCGEGVQAFGNTPALALCIAILRASGKAGEP